MIGSNNLVSVIMPVYNTEKYLKTSIDSILSQTYENIEFIIIDDGSTDNSINIVESYSDKRIRFYKQDNRGIAISLNKGISLAKGDFIARQDADDISNPFRIEKQMQLLIENKHIGLIGTCANLIDENGLVIKPLNFPGDNNSLQKYILTKNPFIHGSIIMRKECLKKVGLYREQFLLAQSYDMWLRISEKYEIMNIQESLYDYRIWNNCVSNKKAALFSLFSNIALELHKERMENQKDILMGENNYHFYEKYGEKIINETNKYEVFRWLK